MVWKGNSCTDGECGWFRTVPSVQMGFVSSSCSNQLRIGSLNV
jgi:hypothetical protein